jgi:hypothetical protein
MRRRNLLALLAVAACATPGPPIEPAWLLGRWQTSAVSAVTGGNWTLEVVRVTESGGVEGSWYSGAQRSLAAIRIEGDRLLVLAPNGEQGRFRRTPEGTLDGIVRPAGRDTGSVPVVLERR